MNTNHAYRQAGHVLLAAGLGTLLLGSLSFAAVHSFKAVSADREGIRAAVESGDYAAFRNAVTAQVPIFDAGFHMKMYHGSKRNGPWEFSPDNAFLKRGE